MEPTNNKKEFLDKYKQLCVEYDCCITGCGCNKFIDRIDDRVEDINYYLIPHYTKQEVIDIVLFSDLEESLENEDTR